MARKKIQDDVPRKPPNLIISRKDAEQKINIQIEKGCAVKDTIINSDTDLERARDLFLKWSNYNEELLTRIFDNDSIVQEYKQYRLGIGVISVGPPSMYEKIKDFKDDVSEKISKLESIKERLELIPEIAGLSSMFTARTNEFIPQGRDIFIAHGRDEGTKEAVARFISTLELNPIILHEQPNAGRTIIEKFEDYSNVSFAIVILTPDDIGTSKDMPSNQKERARQNVILELGYFLGKLGRDRVCALYKSEVEIPSDYKGVLYIPMDEKGAWKLQLGKEIKQAKIDIDLNRAI